MLVKYRDEKIMLEAIQWNGNNLDDTKEFVKKHGWKFLKSENGSLFIRFRRPDPDKVQWDFVSGWENEKDKKTEPSICIDRCIRLDAYIIVCPQKPSTLRGLPKELFKKTKIGRNIV